jgi:hypothetical protein
MYQRQSTGDKSVMLLRAFTPHHSRQRHVIMRKVENQITRPSIESHHDIVCEDETDLLLLIFWSIYQLESDIRIIQNYMPESTLAEWYEKTAEMAISQEPID